jgi:hypothetical protein
VILLDVFGYQGWRGEVLLNTFQDKVFDRQARYGTPVVARAGAFCAGLITERGSTLTAPVRPVVRRPMPCKATIME